MNAVEIEEAISLLAEQPFVPAEFPYAFLEAFGNKSTTIKRLQTGNNNKSDIEKGVLQHNNIHLAVCDEGKVAETLKKLKESPTTTKAKAKFILATDGVEFQAEDLNSGETVACEYPNFHNYFGFFLPLAGISTVKQIRENAFDIKATSRLNKLYIELLRHNPEWATAERRHDMNHFLARLIFCFFAEDTGIFTSDGLFTDTVQQMSAGDATDTHEIIGEIFRAMDTKQEERVEKKVKNWAYKFPYVNGQLFSGSTETPKFTKIARSYLLHVGILDWKKINPDIFGSMIQAVADDDERGALGMHYTSVPNILKVLNPLFLDDLRAQLEEADGNARKLLNLRKRISHIRVFDPACGSGNFLVIAYKQMREIEYEINKLRGENNLPTEIPLTNYRGIELRDFSAEIARLALIIAEYQCDVLYRGQKLALAEFLPLNSENWITCGNALRINWLSICPPTGVGVKLYADDLFSTNLAQSEIDFENAGGETYICGNPPYLGGKKQDQSQKLDMISVFGKDFPYKNLDYICAFFEKASLYLSKFDRAAFVTTSSINQGSHVPTLWPRLIHRGISILFAYKPFKWANNAANNAGVYVTILGICKERKCSPVIYSDGLKREVAHINSYLIAAPEIIVEKESQPISNISKIITGNAAYDAQHLRLTDSEVNLLKKIPESTQIIRRMVGTSELLTGTPGKCLWIDDIHLQDALKIPIISEKIEKVKLYRESGGEVARTLVTRPHQFRFRNVAKRKQIVVPQVCSAEFKILPVDLLEPDIIVTHLAHVMLDPEIYNLSIISSRLHFAWALALSGRHGDGLRYGSNLCWNTFPVPLLTEKNKEDLTLCAEEILIARERHFPATISELYNSEEMPEDLQLAHDRNDEVLERIYIGRRFKNDTERLEKLFDLYTEMTIKRKAV
ncbi:MAG: class I SAM-dependent DNA methyltransferase [Bacteroidetes bacterium]|nr:class I SAM-dependent DNA methyltransferase [Bacteroidota bacterium]